LAVFIVPRHQYIYEIAKCMLELTGRDEIEEALDKLEYGCRITLKH